MIRVCAWCGEVLGSNGDKAPDGFPVTHGMCPTCSQTIFSQSGEPMGRFLDRLGVPVLVIDSQARVAAANRQGCKALGKDITDIRGRLGGEAIECAHAKEPGGCGGTVHCRTCTIRNTVLETFATGRPCSGVRAYPDVEIDNQTKTLCFEISTEKVGDVVLLRIDDLRETDGRQAN